MMPQKQGLTLSQNSTDIVQTGSRDHFLVTITWRPCGHQPTLILSFHIYYLRNHKAISSQENSCKSKTIFFFSKVAFLIVRLSQYDHQCLLEDCNTICTMSVNAARSINIGTKTKLKTCLQNRIWCYRFYHSPVFCGEADSEQLRFIHYIQRPKAKHKILIPQF